MTELALGATVFQRAEKVADLLASIGLESPIETVYLADNGHMTDRKRDIYDAQYPFDLEVLDLPYNSGLGYGRRKIVAHSDEPYLLIVDSDVEIPHNINHLLRILQVREDLGGVGGVLVESGRLRSDCHDLFEDGRLLVKDIRTSKAMQSVEGLPLVEFDQIQNVALYRRECLEAYCWDPEYTIGWEHTDFFVAHKKRTDWSFGVCPEVMFRHYPGGDDAYLSKRRDAERLRRTKRYFLDKWDYEQVMIGHIEWLQSTERLPSTSALIQTGVKRLLMQSSPEIKIFAMNLRDRLRTLRGLPPA